MILRKRGDVDVYKLVKKLSMKGKHVQYQLRFSLV